MHYGNAKAGRRACRRPAFRLLDYSAGEPCSFKLYTADRTAGALNLFGREAGAWDTEAETVGSIFAAHAAAAILAARHGEQLHSAVSTRDRIGQAKGIIMERFGVDDVRAFELLRMLSQEGQVKLAVTTSSSAPPVVIASL